MSRSAGGGQRRRRRARRAARRAARAAARTALLGGLLSLTACTIYPDRGPISDFFFKDYELPEYDPRQAAFHRHRRMIEPDSASGAVGGVLGAVAGGRTRAWRQPAGGAMGGLGGAAVGAAYAYTEAEEPLPETYDMLTLALPIIATDPNKGPTAGVLPVGVVKEGERITNIFAPDVTYNEIDGVGGIFRMRRFFSRSSFLLLDAGSTSNGAHDYEVIYSQRLVGPNRNIYYQGRFAYRTTLDDRFYGVGNDTDEDAESNFVWRRTTGAAVLGVELPLDFDLELKERITSYDVRDGVIDDVPSTTELFPGTFGVEQQLTILTHQVRLSWDVRNSRTTPDTGYFAHFLYEVSDSTLGSDVAFQRFGLSLIGLFPKLGGHLVTAARVAGTLMIGDRIPFYELAVIGGKETVRGYGFGRFRGKNAYVANLEERINLPRFSVAGNELVVQLAAFVDVGRVYDDGETFTLRDSKIAAGGAVRMIVPNSELVASIDMGFSDEGSAVFVGLDYPY